MERCSCRDLLEDMAHPIDSPLQSYHFTLVISNPLCCHNQVQQLKQSVPSLMIDIFRTRSDALLDWET